MISHTHHFPVAVRRLHCMQSVGKGRGIVAVVRSRQVVAVHGSSDLCFQCSFGRDFGLWSFETGGRSMQVVINARRMRTRVTVLCLSVCLFVTSLPISFQVYITNCMYLRVLR